MAHAAAQFQVEIVPVGNVTPEALTWLGAELELQYPWTRCRIARPFARRAEWWEPDTGRFWADRVLDSLEEWHAAEHGESRSCWLLGVTTADLAAPDRPYAFGEATVGGCCAVISLARFCGPDSDPAAGRALLRLRMLKEACHELGHVLGLDHCDRATCVMFPAAGVETVDRKSSDLCSTCSRAAEQMLHRQP
jgi:archaemetzincin